MIISCISYKGGVGKSTISQNLAVCFAHSGHRVCIADADESQNSKYWVGKRESELPGIDVHKTTNEKNLAREISKLYDAYDYVFIDSPPSQSVIADKIILLSHLVLVPVTTKGGSEVNTAEQFIGQIEELEITKEKKIPTRFVINEFDQRSILHNEFLQRIKEYPIKPLEAILHRRVAYGEANLLGKGVYEHTDPKAKNEIVALTNEIIEMIN